MGNDIYTSIGYIVVWILRFVLVPIGVAVIARLVADKLLGPQPERQKKKRPVKHRF